ncbi:MAG: hypothetical protein KI793_09940 [Rivularia sp. (in: Bacteria)]|nr:hypothetical protein [Rivularia sp. MS3]
MFPKRVIFTQDRDFLVIGNTNKNHPGIVFYNQGTRLIREIIDYLKLMYEVMTPEEMRGWVKYFVKI